MFKLGPVCQSCSMPLSKDPQGGGMNADGSKSTEYCSFCYKNGEFTQPGPMEHFRETLEKNMKEKKHPWIIRMIMWYSIPKMGRWRQK